MSVEDSAFVAARERAMARDGVLAGRYALVNGELLRLAHHERRPGLVQLSFTTTARHRDGGVLELTARDGDNVRATWWRGLNNDRGETIPAGFRWEKNDDYYYGTVGWDELRDVTVDVRRH
ncbi:hypothetical protein [Luedemannella helvata]|uniref:Uncharacterized protein n=1 Tax=Luedemannella helvata TaxID=349315 RepID=A0ABN2L552_9ACTN